MKLQDLSLEQLKEIVDGAPEGAEFKFGEKYGKDWRANLDDPEIDPKQYPWRYALWCSATKSWNDSIFVGEDYSGLFLNLSDICTAIAQTESVFKVGDRVVFIDASCFPDDVLAVTQITEFEICLSNGMSLRHDLKWLRHATPEEIATGHRIDEPSSSCGMSGAEIDQFGEDLRNKPYVDLPEFEHKPDTITAQLDPAKCRIVDPALPYDEPAKRRVGWVGCLDFGAIGDALQGNQSNFDAMSEKHRSPSCKCHEFPIDAELEAPAGMKHDQSKPRYSLIPAGALALVVDVLEYGATKYAPDNWKHVENARERYYNASMRHVQAWWSGEQVDSESGLPHLAHAICSLMFLMTLDGEQGE